MEVKMKKVSVVLLVIFTLMFFLSAATAIAQGPGDPPDPPVGPQAEAGKYVATPIGGGILVLLSIVGYGVYRLRRNN